MKTREDILRILASHKKELQSQYKISRMALFGSWSRGDQRSDSDVDILVDIEPSIGLDFITLAERMEALLGMKVDLVSSRAIKSRAWDYISKEMIHV